jgi:transglutaminase-like putative cysteine protease
MRKIMALALVAAAGCSSGEKARPMPMQGKEATFDARLEFVLTAPEDTKKLRAWLSMPQEDPNQTVRDFRVDAPVAHRIEKDSEGNTVVYVEAENPPKEIKVVETFRLTRREQRTALDPTKTRLISDDERRTHAKHLDANANVVISDEIQELAAKIAAEEKNPIVAARKLYDWTLENVEYWVKYPDRMKASPVGSSEHCLNTRTGNCTDFHSLWAALARASGIPTRLVYGSFFKKELDGQDKDQSYHCWPEFYVPNYGWVPHDVAVADIFAGDFALTKDNESKVKLTTADGYTGPDKAKVDYYFGNIDERRVAWSRGRDLMLSPRQDAGPVNALPKAYVEVDGQVGSETKVWTRKLTYKEVK